MNKIENWWKGAVVYQIYPRSFKDSNGDGIGDLKGIISKLDYIKSLDIDIIWLNPIYASPNKDNGYDISDYKSIMKECGTMQDFDVLLEETHRRGMKLILDLVVNHTSEEHIWFKEGRSSRENPYYHYFHWWPAEKGNPPLRKSYFDDEGSAWKYNKDTNSYYLHYFSSQQPDLNWENPQVRREIFDMMRYWFDKGIDGFRMDSIPLISKDTGFPKINLKKYPDIFSYYAQGPHLHEYLHEMNHEVISQYDAMSVGEGSEIKAKEVANFVEPQRQELNMLYGFGPCAVRNSTPPDNPDTGIEYSLVTLKNMFTDWDKGVGEGWPAVYLGNHDQARMLSRFGWDKDPYREISAKMLATFLLTLRGTVYWFAGDEIGMRNIYFTSLDEYKDVDTISNYYRIKQEGGDAGTYLKEQAFIARDNARTPFQWDNSPNAGFTTGKPWIKINPDYTTVNVAAEEANPESVLNYFRKAVRLRKEYKAIKYGNYRLLDEKNPFIYAYLREQEEELFFIALNFTPQPATMELSFKMENAEIKLCNYKDPVKEPENGMLYLRPFEAGVWNLL